MYDYGARNYDPSLGSWMNIDPKAEKYYNIGSYVYVVNNPIFYIDPDGRDILPWIVHHLKKPSLDDINQYGYFTPKLLSTMKEVMSTTTGRNYLSQFMKKGQNFSGYKADKNGKYSDVNLNIIQYDLQGNDKKFNGIKGAAFRDGTVSVTENNEKLNISIWTFGEDLETITHELFAHNSGIIDEIISAFRKGGIKEVEKVNDNGPSEDDDHRALRDLDNSHEGVKNYIEFWNELAKKEDKKRKIFEQIRETNNHKYEGL
jgi:hypothetical protein